MRRTGEQVKEKVERRMSRIDALTPELRAVVHEYGWRLVSDFMDRGVTKPRDIVSLIKIVLLEMRPVDVLDKGREGCVMVPREPSSEMIDAGLASTNVWLNIPGSALTVNREKMRRRYIAMIAKFSGQAAR